MPPNQVDECAESAGRGATADAGAWRGRAVRGLAARDGTRRDGTGRDGPRRRLGVAVIVVVTAAAFANAPDNALVNWDDTQNLVENDKYLGVTPGHIRWMFTTYHAGHYQPLTWLSFALDAALWDRIAGNGDVWRARAVGYHVTNVLLHIAVAIGVWAVSRRLLRVAMPSAGDGAIDIGAVAAALMFAVHPLRVESVAWATERRDVLSAAWLVLSAVLYVRAVHACAGARRRRRLAMSVACFVLSLLSKASGVTWPIVLLVLDVFPLRRVGGVGGARHAAVRTVVWEKLVFAVPAVVFAVIAADAQQASGALRSLAEHPIGLRIGQACYGVMFYPWKTLVPACLVTLYEQRPDATALDIWNVVSACVAVGVSVWLVVQRSRVPGVLAAWCAYVVVVAPVLGLVQSGPQVVADRYSYVSCMAWAVLAGGGVCAVWCRARSSARRAGFVCVLIVVIGVLVGLTRRQVRTWRNSETLWRHVLACHPNTPTAHANLAHTLIAAGRFAEARTHALATLEVLPGNRSAHIAVARCALERGDLVEAKRHYARALAIRPHDMPTTMRLVEVLTRLGRVGEAEAHYADMLSRRPADATLRFNYAGLLASTGRTEDAIRELRRVLDIDPEFEAARRRLAILRRGQKEHE